AVGGTWQPWHEKVRSVAKRRGVKVALFSGLAALVALIAFPAICWREVLTRYYEAELRKEPSCLVRFLGERPFSAKRLALSRFFLTPEGKKRLVRKYLEAIALADDKFAAYLQGVRTGESERWLLFWATSGDYRVLIYKLFGVAGVGGDVGSKKFENMS